MINVLAIFRKLVLLTTLLLFFQMTYGQGTVSGKVTDAGSNPLIGAYVSLEGTEIGSSTDVEGRYSLTVPSGEQRLSATYIGYGTQTLVVTVPAGGNVQLDFVLNEDAIGLDELVVTGTFSGRSQKNSPISMTVLNARQLSELSFNSQADILRNIPGITAEGGGGEVASNVFVRGMPSGGQYQFTPLQVDGLPTISTFGLNSSAHDVYFRNDIGIRNLEFVRGGASTLFGAGSVAGIINYTSITGTAEQENKVGLEWAQMGRMKVDFLTAGPLSENLFYAFSGFYRYDEGPLETGLNTRGYQIRGNLKKVFNQGKSSFTIYTQAIDDNVQFYLPYPLANNDGTFERPEGNDGETIYTLLSGEATDFSFDTPNGRFESPIENGVITRGGYVMGDLKHSFGNDWRLHSKVKAAKYDHWFNLFLDGDGANNVPETQADYLSSRGLPSNARFTYVDTDERLTGEDLVFQNRVLDRRRPMEELAGELNFTKTISTASAEHNITVGTYLSNTRAEDDNWLYNYLGDFSNSPRMVGLVYTDSTGAEVDYSTGGFIAGNQTANRHFQSTKTAIYLADEIKGDRYSFDVGVRWERAVGVISSENGVGSNTFNKGEVSADDFAVALAGLYKVTDNVNVYANASKGYFFPELRGVRFQSPGVPQTYETEQIIQGELGTKIGTKNFAATAAIFYVGLSDRRSVDFVNDGMGGVIEEVVTQSTQTIGFESSINYFLVEGVAVNALITFQDHEFTKVEANAEQEGNWLRRQPQFKGTIGLTLDRGPWDGNFSATYLGKRYANDANTVELDPYTVVRAGIGYTIGLGEANESLRLGVSVFNLLDSEGITEGSPRQGNAQTGSAEYFVGRPILPRRISIRALFSF
jgi:iron complex outermembrane receptor protein